MANLLQRSLYLLLSIFCSCAHVQPGPDFKRTQVLVERSTGVQEFYQPQKKHVPDEELMLRVADGLALEEAVSIALLNNRELQNEVLEIGISHAELVEAGVLSNPVLSLVLKFPDGGGRSNLESSIAQSISDIWKLPKRKRAAERKLEKTILQVARRAGEVVGATRAAFYESLAASMLVETVSGRVTLAKDVHRAVTVLKEAGAVGALDENLASGELLRAELELQETEFEERRLLRNLAALLSLELRGDELKGKLEPPDRELDPGICLIDSSSLLSVAQAERLDLKAFSMSVEEADALVRLEQWSIMPEFSLGASIERPEKAPGEGEGGIDYLLGPEVSLGIPIFDQNQAQIAIARLRQKKAQKEFEAAKLLVTKEIDEAVDRVRTARRAHQFFLTKLLPQAEQNLDYARVSYEGGESNLLTLIESQRALLDARRGLIDVTLQARKALVELDRAVGTPISSVCSKIGAKQQ